MLSQLTHEEQIDQLKLPLRIKHFISEGLENFQVGNLWQNSSCSCEIIGRYNLLFQEDVALSVNNHNLGLSHW